MSSETFMRNILRERLPMMTRSAQLAFIGSDDRRKLPHGYAVSSAGDRSTTNRPGNDGFEEQAEELGLAIGAGFLEDVSQVSARRRLADAQLG